MGAVSETRSRAGSSAALAMTRKLAPRLTAMDWTAGRLEYRRRVPPVTRRGPEMSAASPVMCFAPPPLRVRGPEAETGPARVRYWAWLMKATETTAASVKATGRLRVWEPEGTLMLETVRTFVPLSV